MTLYYQSGAVMAQLLLYMLDETKDEERLAHVCVCVRVSCESMEMISKTY